MACVVDCKVITCQLRHQAGQAGTVADQLVAHVSCIGHGRTFIAFLVELDCNRVAALYVI